MVTMMMWLFGGKTKYQEQKMFEKNLVFFFSCLRPRTQLKLKVSYSLCVYSFGRAFRDGKVIKRKYDED